MTTEQNVINPWSGYAYHLTPKAVTNRLFLEGVIMCFIPPMTLLGIPFVLMAIMRWMTGHAFPKVKWYKGWHNLFGGGY